MKSTLEIRNALPKPYKRGGQIHQPANNQGFYHADVLPGHSIRIFGTMTNRAGGPVEFDKVFKLGDVAEYGSYNLIYTGRIVCIGPKTVTIKHYDHTATVTMLEHFSFIDRNFDFDLERIAKHNGEESQYI